MRPRAALLRRPALRPRRRGPVRRPPAGLPAEVPAHASQMYAKNVVTFLEHLVEDGQIVLDFSDEITAGTVMTHGGQVVNERLGGTLPVSESPDSGSAEEGEN